MARSKSSHRWLREHFSDPYVKRTRAEGYRSRASYKLLEIQQKDKLFKPGMTVIDLGAAPGGWSQVVADLVAPDRAAKPGRVIATDILPMDALPGVEFLQGDFTEQAVLDNLLALLGGGQADLVISDMAPNMSGIKAVDQPKATYLVELALDLAKRTLIRGGGFVTKAFQGEGFDELHRELKAHFGKVASRKPDASRPRSREIYLVASDFKGDSV